MVTIVAYLSGYDSKVREEYEIDDEEYQANPEEAIEKARQSLIKNFGTDIKGSGYNWKRSTKQQIETIIMKQTSKKYSKIKDIGMLKLYNQGRKEHMIKGAIKELYVAIANNILGDGHKWNAIRNRIQRLTGKHGKT